MNKSDESLERFSRSSSDAELKTPPVIDYQPLSRERESESPSSVAQISEIPTVRSKEEQALVVYQDKRLESLTTLIDAAESIIQHSEALNLLQAELQQVQKDLDHTNSKFRQVGENIARIANDFKQKKSTALGAFLPLDAENYIALSSDLSGLKVTKESLQEKILHEEKSLQDTKDVKEKAQFVTKVRHKFGLSFRDIEQLSNQLNTMKNQNIVDQSVYVPLQEQLYNIQRAQQQLILTDNPPQAQKQKVRDDFFALKEKVDGLMSQRAEIAARQEIPRKSLLQTQVQSVYKPRNI